MRVLVTGGTGFIGREAVGALITSGAQVHIHCRRPQGLFGNIPTTCGDLTSPGAATELLEQVKPDILLHLAWNVEHGKFWTNRQNIDWTAASLLLARAALDVGVRRIVGVGTCYEYCWPVEGNCREDETAITPTSLYAVAKDATRRVLEELSDVSFAWARLFYLFGPFEHADRLVPSLASSLVRGETASLSSGKVVRDFMHTRDAGAALAALALSDIKGAINIASGEGVSVASIAECLGAIAGRPDLIQIGALPDREGEPPRIVADVRRLRDEVGFRQSLTLQEGLADSYSWWRRQLECRQ
jgi:nucleoside-diphosphate-sugar epimerase